MSLETGSDRAAFEESLRVALAAGRPEAEALAIAYAQQRPDGEAVIPPPMLAPSPVNPMFQAVMAIQALNARADAILSKAGGK